MSTADKTKNAAQDLTGKAKEAAGKVTDNEELQGQGKADQTKADAKKPGENIKGVFKNRPKSQLTPAQRGGLPLAAARLQCFCHRVGLDLAGNIRP